MNFLRFFRFFVDSAKTICYNNNCVFSFGWTANFK